MLSVTNPRGRLSRVALLFCLLSVPLRLCGESSADPVDGVTLAHLHRRGYGYGSDECRGELARIKALGANWVALNDFAYMPAVDSPVVVDGRDGSLTEADLRRTVRDARAAGLKVMLKPHLWSRDFNRGKWAADVAMMTDADWAAWFESYGAYVLGQAAIAAEEGADALCVGVELQGTSGREAEWRALIAKVRAVYGGPLTYAATWGEWEHVAWWDALDVIGIDAYFPLTDKPSATDDELRAGWARVYDRLGPFAARVGKPICFLELGYTADAGGGIEPWKHTVETPDPPYQARLYRVALEEAAKRDYVVGAFVWKWFTSDDWRRMEGGDEFAVQDVPAVLDVLREAWAR